MTPPPPHACDAVASLRARDDSNAKRIMQIRQEMGELWP